MTTLYDIKNQGGVFTMGTSDKDREDIYTIFVPGVHRATCRWGNHGIPAKLSLHPVDEDLVAAYITAIEQPDDIGCMVQIRYVPRDVVRQASQWNQLEPIDGQARFRWTSDATSTDIPYFYRTKISSTATSPLVWAPAVSPRPETLTIIEAAWTANLSVGTVNGSLDALEAEIGNLHDVLGAKALFLGGNGEQIDYQRWEIRARWQRDPGTPNLGGNVPDVISWPDAANITYLDVAKDPQFIRKPFHKLEASAVAEGYPATNPANIIQSKTYRSYVAAGAGNLPGSPL